MTVFKLYTRVVVIHIMTHTRCIITTSHSVYYDFTHVSVLLTQVLTQLSVTIRVSMSGVSWRPWVLVGAALVSASSHVSVTQVKCCSDVTQGVSFQTGFVAHFLAH